MTSFDEMFVASLGANIAFTIGSSGPCSAIAPGEGRRLAATRRPALFLDRDGVLNEERAYLHDPGEVALTPGAGATIAAFNRSGIPVVVVTNQAGIGRGLYDVGHLEAVNNRIADLLAQEQGRVDAWYFCPHVPAARCVCRKPAPGMLLLAATELGIDLPRSALVGDKESDLLAARRAGCRALLVRTGYGRAVEEQLRGAGAAGRFDACYDSLAQLAPVLLSSPPDM